ncbi:putative RNA methyltransferase [uncultured Friedmanniella sp.]|uniref:putative RNA methyltransferase n=1 Tax=uncultured Friedmanniella sp. TaxID=335381 RepID=UPI0035C98D08
MSLGRVLDLLCCPVCRQPFTPTEGGVRCAQGHTFDQARQGYLNLLQSRPPQHADTPAMVAARERFLGGGHYRAIADGLVEAVHAGLRGGRPDPLAPLSVLEVGAGTGYYLQTLLDALPGRGVALDISVAAARRAARTSPRIAAVVADTWQPLPVADRVLDVLTCVFAPRNPAEFARVLRPDGVLAVVSPLPTHLAGLRESLGLMAVVEDKQERLGAALAPWFDPLDERRIQQRAGWPADVLIDLVAMGPNAFHADADRLAEQVHRLPDPLEVEVAVTVRTWRPSDR